VDRGKHGASMLTRGRGAGAFVLLVVVLSASYVALAAVGLGSLGGSWVLRLPGSVADRLGAARILNSQPGGPGTGQTGDGTPGAGNGSSGNQYPGAPALAPVAPVLLPRARVAHHHHRRRQTAR
jgi:hypothetical protein